MPPCSSNRRGKPSACELRAHEDAHNEMRGCPQMCAHPLMETHPSGTLPHTTIRTHAFASEKKSAPCICGIPGTCDAAAIATLSKVDSNQQVWSREYVHTSTLTKGE
eukprot:6310508-Amphidinium_carterae.1